MRRTAYVLTLSFAVSLVIQTRAQSIRDKAITLRRMIEINHFSPRPVNDSFSILLFNSIINTSDPRRLLFTASEYNQLNAYRTTLDDELMGKGWAFFDMFTKTYRNAIVRADSIVKKVSEKPMDFSTNETITRSKEPTFIFSADTKALTDKWARFFKFSILDQAYEQVLDDSTGKKTLKEILAKAEPVLREKLKQSKLKAFASILEKNNDFTATAAELYLNAVSSTFDPHTNYFSPSDKESFQAQLSTEAYSFGLELEDNRKGQIVIDKLVPGGPAWKSGELNKGDELISLQWEGKKEVEMTAASSDDAYEVLEQSVHDRLVFKFRKPDGAIKIVLLRKEKIDNEENIVKGFVLKGEKKIGYILLPGFYTEWGNETGSSCANDVAKEIVKLKRENIEGLILDVRFNGGGSVQEAIEMIGIFIDEGPLAADKAGNGKLSTYRDPNRGTIYDGPMALMVNGQSASASEMLAASLQDYNRALIVGSNTYGKATMQQMFPLDTNSRKPLSGDYDKDAVKITIRKLYRLNGQSAQRNGVSPDIVLPDAFDGLEFREKFQENSLPTDTAKRNTIYRPLPALPISELSNRSQQRVNNGGSFTEIKKLVQLQQKAMREGTQTIPLKAENFEQWAKQNYTSFDYEEENDIATKLYSVENHAQEKQLLQNNLADKEVNALWLQNLAKDFYVEETFQILTDLINIQKK